MNIQIYDELVSPDHLSVEVESIVASYPKVFGSAIAFEPGSYDFEVHNITIGVSDQAGNPITTPNLDSDGHSLYCPYAYGSEHQDIVSLDLSEVYDYSRGQAWWNNPKELWMERAAKGESGCFGVWSEPYLDEAAGVYHVSPSHHIIIYIYVLTRPSRV